MKDVEQRAAAKAFAKDWAGKGYEKGDTHSFWISFLQDVIGLENAVSHIEFEKEVVIDGNTKFIDVYLPDTRVMVEQKSLDKDLNKPIVQSGGIKLTPFEQAKNYANNLPVSESPKWIITCNFGEFQIYNMNKPGEAPTKILLSELPKRYSEFGFLIDNKKDYLKHELEVSVKAGELVGKIYDAFLELYPDKEDPKTLHSLNVLCVRLVFCLYAEDAGIFGRRDMFHDYLNSFNPENMRMGLIELFKILDTKPEDRDPFANENLLEFPYVNGGLFSTDEDILIPQITEDIRNLILDKASMGFDWSDISPTIFGAVFESTLNPETRRSGGMHYTSIENIHKVIDPLFLDELKGELDEIKQIGVLKTKETKLKAFQNKLAGLTWLDPAAGSGNFLTETYLCIRRLENDVIGNLIALEKGQTAGQIMMGVEYANPIKVSIQQFYGIEINDFAVTVATTALWIAESQMLKETENIVHLQLGFLPLKTYVNIVEGNALRIDWNDVVPASQLNYIMGNPPFVGQAMRSKEQAQEMLDVFEGSNSGGKLDYVAGWYKKAVDYSMGTKIETAFVSSNSICQGESVNLLWEKLLHLGVVINFAHRTFAWTSEAKNKAAVMCVIVGFSFENRDKKYLFDGSTIRLVKHINGYLYNGPDVFIKNRSKSINAGAAKVAQGSPPADNGRLILTVEEKEDFIKKYPELNSVIRPLTGSREFINDLEFSRFCFWFEGVDVQEYMHIPELRERFQYIHEYRLASPVDRIQKTADKPYLFTQNRQPTTNYIIIPRVSSSSRRYIPMGYLSPDIIASDSAVLMHNATLYEFGLLSSNAHNAWMRVVAGRLKNDFRYAPSVFYNFPLPDVTDEFKAKIEQTGRDILLAREKYQNKTLADMYGADMYLFSDLQIAHRANDRAVWEAYGKAWDITSESDCVAYLMKLYQELTTKE